jgi:surface protein
MENFRGFDDMASEYMKEFEELNMTTESIRDLGDFDVLIILKDGTNLTDWKDVGFFGDIMYVSEDLSDFTDLSQKYEDMFNLKAVVALNVTDRVTSLNSMFSGCHSLKDISSLSDWDTSNVEDMEGMFCRCKSLADFSPLEGWNVSGVETMKNMFLGCESD